MQLLICICIVSRFFPFSPHPASATERCCPWAGAVIIPTMLMLYTRIPAITAIATAGAASAYCRCCWCSTKWTPGLDQRNNCPPRLFSLSLFQLFSGLSGLFLPLSCAQLWIRMEDASVHTTCDEFTWFDIGMFSVYRIAQRPTITFPAGRGRVIMWSNESACWGDQHTYGQSSDE